MNNSAEVNEARRRIEYLFDDGSFTEIDAFAKSADGEVEVIAGCGNVGNAGYCYAISQDVSVNGGAISVAQCAKIKKVYNLAKKTGYPVITIYDSNGVKLTEGFEALSAYGGLVKDVTALSGVVPQIAVVAGACVGTSALMANMADVVIAVKDADFYVTAPSEITVEESYSAGTVDIMTDTVEEALDAAKKVKALLPANNLEAVYISADICTPPVLQAADGVTASQTVEAIADASTIVEFKAGYGENVVTALGTVMGQPVGFVAFDGKAVCPACAYKAEAMIKLCDAYNIPIITVANADGLEKNKENQMLVAATKLTSAYACATSAKISLVTGQSIGAAYIILAGKGANADLTFAWDSAVASPLDAQAAVAFLYNDRLANGENRAELEKEYKETIGSPFTAAACGAIDDVFPAQDTRDKIAEALYMLSSKRETTIARKHSVK